ncbi:MULTISPECIES: acyltransferase [unclassified Caballeronia]|uniref:acyltransferase family protein n=1 Tax=unclassified Caballeronia TaxID=2646786 RepID=UPI0020288504|nr:MULTISPECIES: acyltransferase [unclassified Caballeronia]MDR5766023.1 acyltransferase [Caballeronia sp. LZ028]
MTTRYHQLDSLRGIAALTVVFSHYSQITLTHWLQHVPWRAIAEGHSAVILFFALSGFALAMQITGDSRPGFAEFIVKRVCRIYIPYLIAVLAAYTAYCLLYRSNLSWTGEWVNQAWHAGIDRHDLLDHLYFVIPFSNSTLDPVLWSLVYEMRISLIFPLLVVVVFATPVWFSVALSMCFSLAAFGYYHHLQRTLLDASIQGEWMPTIHYMSMFVLGALIARYREAISSKLGAYSARTLFGALLICLALYVLVGSITRHSISNDVLRSFADDWIILPAVTGILVLAIALRPFAAFLTARPLIFLGEISFSLYLLHCIVLLGVLHYFGETYQGMSLIIAAVLILPVSIAGYYAVEKPSIRLGRYLTRGKQRSRVTQRA